MTPRMNALSSGHTAGPDSRKRRYPIELGQVVFLEAVRHVVHVPGHDAGVEVFGQRGSPPGAHPLAGRARPLDESGEIRAGQRAVLDQRYRLHAAIL